MPRAIRTSLATILPLILTRLQAVTELPAEACFLSQAEEMPFDGLADQYIWLKVDKQTSNIDQHIGAGRVDSRQVCTLVVTVRTRLALDSPARDTAWLTDTSLGHLILTDKVEDALETFTVEDDDGNILANEPMIQQTDAAPRKDPRLKEWGESRMYFTLNYTRDLDQSYQG